MGLLDLCPRGALLEPVQEAVTDTDWSPFAKQLYEGANGSGSVRYGMTAVASSCCVAEGASARLTFVFPGSWHGPLNALAH